MESTWYNTFLNIFNWQYVNSAEKDDKITSENVQLHARRRPNKDMNSSIGVAIVDNSVDEHEVENEHPDPNINEQHNIKLFGKIVTKSNIKENGKRCDFNIITSAEINRSKCELIDIEDGKDP